MDVLYQHQQLKSCKKNVEYDFFQLHNFYNLSLWSQFLYYLMEFLTNKISVCIFLNLNIVFSTYRNMLMTILNIALYVGCGHNQNSYLTWEYEYGEGRCDVSTGNFFTAEDFVAQGLPALPMFSIFNKFLYWQLVQFSLKNMET